MTDSFSLHPANDSAGQQTRESGPYPIEENGPLSPEKLFERFCAARDSSAEQSNRLVILGLIFVGLSCIKISGLRIDISLFDTKVMEVPYGVFFYIVASQILFAFAIMRISDARAHEQEITLLSKRPWPLNHKSASSTFSCVHEWLIPASLAIQRTEISGISRILLNLAPILTVIFGFIVHLSPLISGVFYVINWKEYILDGNIGLQYWSVAISSSFYFCWIISYAALHSATEVE